jgi:hypothetical protein
MICVTLFNIVANVLVVFVCTGYEVVKKIRRAKCCKKKREEQVVGVRPSIKELNDNIN